MMLIEFIFNQPKTKIRILDVGCSSGYFRRFLEGNISSQDNKTILYWGLDIRQDVLESAVKDVDDIESGAKGNQIPSAYIVHDIKNGLPFQDNFFDIVVNFEMIKYLPIDQGKQLLAEIYRVLSPQGEFVLSTSYDSHQPGYMQSVPFEQIENLLAQNGFELVTRRGSQSYFRALAKEIKPEHLPLVKDLLTAHPPEMVAAMITPLYPQLCDQVTFYCKIQP